MNDLASLNRELISQNQCVLLHIVLRMCVSISVNVNFILVSLH